VKYPARRIDVNARHRWPFRASDTG
jgi:hypothetical protein